MKLYGDSNTLPANSDDASAEELAALKLLWADKGSEWFTSHLVAYEAMKTKDESKKGTLVRDHQGRTSVPKDEKIVGYCAQTDHTGGFVGFALISDVRDEGIRAELIAQGLKQRDAEHITQAICNNCDVFVTRDKGIIKHRAWLEERFPALRVRLPSELVLIPAPRSLAKSHPC